MSTIKVDTIATRTGSGNITASNNIDLNGNELILDVDGDTSLTADTDDQIDIRISGTDVGTLTNNSGKLTINSTGSNLSFAVGGTVELNTDGTQFYPNADNSHNLGTPSLRFKDLYLSSGVFLGGTGTANKLDDYEEGSWTPVWSQGIGSPGYLVQQGRYTKVGNRVTLSCYLRSNSGSANGSHVYIGGLPFTATSSITAADGGYNTYLGGFYTATNGAQWLVINNSNIVALYRQTDGAALGGTSTGVSMNADVRIVISYQTDL